MPRKLPAAGGAGCIGSHTIRKMIAAAGEPAAADDLRDPLRASLRRAERIAGKPVPFDPSDIRDRQRKNHDGHAMAVGGKAA